MQLETLPVHDLKPAPYNPRLKLKPGDAAWKKLERSLAEFDLVQPIIWNRQTGHVVGGHQRLLVLQHQGREQVDCVVVNLPLEREKLLNIALNNAQIGSTWDTDKLLSLLDELADLPEVDTTLTGFDPQDHRDLLLRPVQQQRVDIETTDANDVVVQLHVQPDEWPQVEMTLNTLLQEFPTMRLHVSGANH